MKKILIISSVLFLAACGGGEKIKPIDALIEEGNLDELKARKVELSNSIKETEEKLAQINAVLKEQNGNEKLPLVTVFEAKQEVFDHFVELQGSVETDQNVVVYPEFSGNLLDIKLTMGDKVSKGQTVAIIDDGGARQQLAQMEEKAALSKITYDRQKRLWDQKIGSELDFLAKETQFNADQEAVVQMKKQLEKAVVTAPFSGIIDEVYADKGQLVMPGQTPIFRIVNLSDMYIQADVPEKYISTVSRGKKVMVSLPVLDTVVKTSISKVSNYINPDNRTFKIEIPVPNHGGIVKPNLTSKLMINDYTNDKAILIPQSIISEDAEGKQYLYVANAKGGSNKATAKKVFITPGKKQGDFIEILSGLSANDAIIKEGARTVKDQQEVQIIK